MKTIRYSKAAAKALDQMPANTAATIVEKIEQYAVDPALVANNLKPLKGPEFKGYERLRVGDYRVIMREDGVVVDIIDVGSRGGIYG